MKIIKRNQLIILVISLMLVTAGYLNFTTRQEGTAQTSGIIEEMALADLGDATLVSGNAIVDNSIKNEKNANNDINAIGDTKSAESTIETSKATDDYFTNTRLEREKMYSQMVESYQKMLDSASVSEVQKGIAQTEINKINETKNAIMIMENLLKLKEIEDIIVLINDQSINVIVKTDKLEQDKVAQIQNIVTREMKTEIENIHISEKK